MRHHPHGPRHAPLRALWLGAGLAMAATAAAAALAPATFPHAWLAAAVLVGGWPLGSLALLLIHPLVGGRWIGPLLPALRAGTALTPLLILLWLPVALTYPALYPPPGAHNAWYLAPGLAALRGAAYLLVWLALAAAALLRHPGRWAAPALILLMLTANFAAIDATGALAPTLNSSAWGMIAATAMVLLALAIAIAWTGPALPRHRRADAAKLLLALVCLWQYLDFMQFLILWQSDLPPDAAWLGPRMRGAWGLVMALVAIDAALLPIAILSIPSLQRSNLALTGVAALLLLGHALRTWWTVLPGAAPFTPTDLLAAAAAAALAAALAATIHARTNARATPGATPGPHGAAHA